MDIQLADASVLLNGKDGFRDRHGNAYDVWKSIGAPHSPTREQEIYLRQQAWNTQMETLRVADDGTLPIRRTLSPWSCMLIKEL